MVGNGRSTIMGALTTTTDGDGGGRISRPVRTGGAAGFCGLTAQKVCKNQLQHLDRHRERQLQRAKRYLRLIPLPQTASSSKKTDVHKYYGRAYSYAAQFQ